MRTRTGLALPLGLLLGGLLASCAEDSPPEIERAQTGFSWAAAIEPLQGALAYDFAAQHGAAERWVEVDGIEPARLEQRRHLTRGWSYPPHSRDTDREELWPLWADAKTAEITFHLREPARRRIKLRINPYHVVLEQTGAKVDFALTLNGTTIDEREIGTWGKQLSIDLPPELQVSGTNRLGLRFSDVWRISEETDANDPRRVAANVGLVSFLTEDDEVRRRTAEAAALCPDGSRVPGVGPGAGLAVEQVSGSALSYFLRVPPHGRLRARAFFGGRGKAHSASAAFHVVLTQMGGGPERIVDMDVPFGAAPLPLNVSLAALAGEVVRLDFEVAAADGSHEAVLGTWIQPVIVTESPAPVPPEQAGLAGVRAGLQGAPVVLVLLDALNPSFLSCYGGRAGLTPNLDRLASEGAVFEAAHAQATYTIASIPSTLTSRYSWEHGAWNEHGKLLEDVPTWPEQFAAAGYRTLGVVHSPNGSSLFGFERGFERFEEVFRGVEEGHVTALAEQVLPVLDDLLTTDDERPPFLWLHIVEPHEPYAPPAPFAGRYSKGDAIRGDAETLWKIREWKYAPTPAEISELEAQYEENLAYVDDVFGRIRTRLESAGIWDQAVIAVFSDHGEGFLDHPGKIFSGCGHGSTVYDEMTRIPLIVRLPEGLAQRASGAAGADQDRGWRVANPTAGMDLLPTIADLVGVPPLEGNARALSFAALLFEGGRPTREFVISHSASFMDDRRFIPAFSIRMGGYKYIHTSGDRPELYDMELDPGETENLAQEYPVLAGYLRQSLRSVGGFDIDRGDVDFEGRAATEIDAETEAQLRALGYGR